MKKHRAIHHTSQNGKFAGYSLPNNLDFKYKRMCLGTRVGLEIWCGASQQSSP